MDLKNKPGPILCQPVSNRYSTGFNSGNVS